MEKLTIIDPNNEDLYGCLGISEQRYEAMINQLASSYNSWRKEETDYGVLILRCCKICQNMNEIAFTSFQIGQSVCKINYKERKTLNTPVNEKAFQSMGISSDRGVFLINNFFQEAGKWGLSGDSEYTTLLINSCNICSNKSEISLVSFMLGFTKYKMEVIAGER